MDYASTPISAIAFQLGDHFNYINAGKSFNVCYNIEENEWNNKKEIQLNIKDIATDDGLYPLLSGVISSAGLQTELL
jgi:hypothetical protein